MSSPTPERKGQRTRQRILSASRRVFAEVGYVKATIRGIAAAADVDKSSVIQYFGSKSNLFREAVHWRIPVDELTVTDPAETAENYLRGLLSGWAAEPDGPMAVLLRNSMTSEDALKIVARAGNRSCGEFGGGHHRAARCAAASGIVKCRIDGDCQSAVPLADARSVGRQRRRDCRADVAVVDSPHLWGKRLMRPHNLGLR